MSIAQLIVIAVLVEAIWENLKMVYDKQKVNFNMIGSLLLGIAICIITRLNIFEILGFSISVPFIGWILTGIICSRGANFVNDLFSKLKGE